MELFFLCVVVFILHYGNVLFYHLEAQEIIKVESFCAL